MRGRHETDQSGGSDPERLSLLQFVAVKGVPVAPRCAEEASCARVLSAGVGRRHPVLRATKRVAPSWQDWVQCN